MEIIIINNNNNKNNNNISNNHNNNNNNNLVDKGYNKYKKIKKMWNYPTQSLNIINNIEEMTFKP